MPEHLFLVKICVLFAFSLKNALEIIDSMLNNFVTNGRYFDHPRRLKVEQTFFNEKYEIKELTIPFMGPGRGILSFQVQCTQFWNSLPPSFRFLPSLSRVYNTDDYKYVNRFPKVKDKVYYV